MFSTPSSHMSKYTPFITGRRSSLAVANIERFSTRFSIPLSSVHSLTVLSMCRGVGYSSLSSRGSTVVPLSCFSVKRLSLSVVARMVRGCSVSSASASRNRSAPMQNGPPPSHSWSCT